MHEQLDGDPIAILQRWTAEAGAPEVPVTMTLATTDGLEPHARTVVITSIAAAGLTFHSSTPTVKSRDLAAVPRAAGVFYWPAQGRQVVLAGAVRELTEEESRARYPHRPRQLQLVAWVYEDLGQNLAEPLAAVPSALIAERMAAAAERDVATLSKPPSWTTFCLTPERLDFWQAGSETVAPTKTRFLLDGGAWVRSEALP